MSLTKYIPYDGIPHAGGQYELQHFRALGPSFGIHAVAPSTPDNRLAIGRLPQAINSAELVRGRGPFRDGRFKLVSDVHSVMRGSSLTAGVGWEVVRDATRRARFASADIIELQWSEVASVAPAMRKVHPGTPIVIVAHDVITQRWRRARDEAGGLPAKAAYSAAAALSGPREAASYAAADLVIVFSEKDADLARRISPQARVEVVLPGLGADIAAPRVRRGPGSTVLFTGAMNRPDNAQGAEWFLKTVWPLVLESVGDAEFVIAGANPPKGLQELVAATPGVRMTGFVESLEPFYESADVFVAPLFTGAGVKFKTIDAMLRSLPIVTTDVGAEGLGDAELYATLTREPAAFARGVIDALRMPDPIVTERARAWAEPRFGFGSFAARITGLYREMLGGR